MATFDKSAVDVAQLSDAEVARVVEALGLGSVSSCAKLTNGGCAANYRVSLGASGREVVVKACVGGDARELATAQLDVLKQLAMHGGAAPAPTALNVVACATTAGAEAAAIAMALLPGEACNILIRDGAIGEAAAFTALGAALARVHKVPPPAGLYDVGEGDYVERYVRCAAPIEAHPEVWALDEPTGFVKWVLDADRGLLAAARAALADASLPRGLLHGDAYLDNVMHDAADGATALVDWEDAAVGPLAFDVATAAVGGCFAVQDDEATDDAAFPAMATPKLDIIRALLGAYAATRGAFRADEAKAFRALMLANAIACALYRFHQFHVTDPAAPRAAKRSYREMHAITMALADPAVAADIDALALAAVRP